MESDKEELSDKIENLRYFKFNPSGLGKAARVEYSFFIITSNKSRIPFLRKKKWKEVIGSDGKPLRPNSDRALKACLKKGFP